MNTLSETIKAEADKNMRWAEENDSEEGKTIARSMYAVADAIRIHEAHVEHVLHNALDEIANK